MAAAFAPFELDVVLEMKRTFLQLKDDDPDRCKLLRLRAASDSSIRYEKSCRALSSCGCSGAEEETNAGSVDEETNLGSVDDEAIAAPWDDAYGMHCFPWSQESPPVSAHKALTTVMLRNLPNSMTRDVLLDLFDASGFGGRYDFVYLPLEFARKRHSNLGYSFVNLLTTEIANEFYDVFHGFRDWKGSTQKVCEVSWSDLCQGFEEHVNKYRNSELMHEEIPDKFRPIVLYNGKRIDFPAPTRLLRSPSAGETPMRRATKSRHPVTTWDF